MTDINTFIDQMENVAKEFFDSHLSSGQATPAQTAAESFDAVASAIEDMLGYLPDQFARIKAAAMSTFAENGFAAALDNLMSGLGDIVDETGLGYTTEPDFVGDGPQSQPESDYQVFGKTPYLNTRGTLSRMATHNDLNPAPDSGMPEDLGFYGRDTISEGSVGHNALMITMYGYTQPFHTGATPTIGGTGSNSVIYGYNSHGLGGKSTIELQGQEGYDRLSIELFATGSRGGMWSNNVVIDGAGGDEVMNMLASAGMVVLNNTFSIDGGAGHDLLNLDINIHHGFDSSGYISSRLSNNHVVMKGGAGDDTLNFNAQVDNTITAPAGGPVAVEANMARNIIEMQGEDGNDTLNFTVDIHNDIAHNGTRSAAMNFNRIFMSGGAGNDALDFSANVYNATTTAGARNAQMVRNDIAMRGTLGDDTLNFSAHIHNDNIAGPPGNGATVNSNHIRLDAGSGNDLLHIDLKAAGNYINVDNNQILMAGGSGNDTLNFDMGANAGIGGNVHNNFIVMLGGAGNDMFHFNLTGSGLLNITNNVVVINGGQGNDTISIDAPSGSGLEYVFQYFNTDELGDVVNRLSSGHNYQFDFRGSVFNGSETGGHLAAANFVAGSAALDANDFWLYYNNGADWVLSYDADGNGTGSAHVVAAFDTDVGMDASHIDLS